MNKIYPSDIAPTYGQTTNGYNKSCPRYFAMSRAVKLPPRGEIDQLYKTIGHMAELRQQRILATQHPRILAEQPIQYALSDSWVISGRMDFYSPKSERIWEIKSTISKARYDDLLAGKINPSHLGQLLTYMFILGLSKGTLVTSYIYLDAAVDFKFVDFTREITIITGEIHVDGQLWPHNTLNDFMSFYKLMLEATEKPDLPAQTINSFACNSCPFKLVCEQNPSSKKEFIDIFNLVGPATIKPQASPKITCHKELL